MASRIARAVQGWHQRRTEARWARLAETAPELESHELRALRSEARGMRRQLDRVMQAADARLAVPPLSAGLAQMPLGTDWSWRPDLWRGALPDPGAVASTDRTALGEGVALYHDCPLGEVVVRQVRNDRPEDRAPYGLAIDVFGFKGSFLSLALNLPEAAVEGLKARHLLRAELVIDCDRPAKAFTRLNIKHGPNLAQPVSSLPEQGREKLAEFDLAYAGLNDRRIERAWLDLILNDAGMSRIVIRDLVVSRRPRAEL
ncbi:DUF6478 family protein [Tabrizicola sp.]|uniref:DUF6478 family protein n=1 Tax=Tabrizicola sp. TaxID=2005166 RepID=UPI001A59B5CD|nr:DUF6478 family protein [Tabrizicola sp.]MBL9075510.1 hypothetical protein [Tabrizicola sp.]